MTATRQDSRLNDGRGDELMTVTEMCAALGGVSRRTFYPGGNWESARSA